MEMKERKQKVNREKRRQIRAEDTCTMDGSDDGVEGEIPKLEVHVKVSQQQDTF